MMFVYYDGDSVGEKFRALFLNNDLEGLALLSSQIHSIHKLIYEAGERRGAKLIESGGDEGLWETDASDFAWAIGMIWSGFSLSVSIGTGDSIRAAYLDCMDQKLTSKKI